jgi:hypothetical protein
LSSQLHAEAAADASPGLRRRLTSRSEVKVAFATGRSHNTGDSRSDEVVVS